MRASRAVALFAFLAAGCGAQPPDAESPEPIGREIFALGTVDDAVANSCSTASVFGLSQQLVDEENCLVPNALAAVPDRPNLTKSSTTFAFLQPPAKDALVAAVDLHPGMTLGLNSMLRTVAQQYMLYGWYKSGLCGIALAAQPGSSNHESGLALDTSDYTAWKSALEAEGFAWLGSSDVVHFDFAGPGTVDLKGQDVLAFQKLWNLNNPNDAIAEDGQYGPQTEARVKLSPAAGFVIPPTCGGATVDAGPDGAPEAGLDAAGLDAAEEAPGSDAGSDVYAWPEASADDAAVEQDAAAAEERPAPAANDAGCSCRIGSVATSRGGLVVALGLAALALRRRARGVSSASRPSPRSRPVRAWRRS